MKFEKEPFMIDWLRDHPGLRWRRLKCSPVWRYGSRGCMRSLEATRFCRRVVTRRAVYLQWLLGCCGEERERWGSDRRWRCSASLWYRLEETFTLSLRHRGA